MSHPWLEEIALNQLETRQKNKLVMFCLYVSLTSGADIDVDLVNNVLDCFHDFLEDVALS